MQTSRRPIFILEASQSGTTWIGEVFDRFLDELDVVERRPRAVRQP
jgi:hypothetical protein